MSETRIPKKKTGAVLFSNILNDLGGQIHVLDGTNFRPLRGGAGICAPVF